MVSHEVEVSDGELSVTFLHGVENPLVNALEVIGIETGDPVAPPELAMVSLPDQSSVEGGSVSLQVSATGGDPQQDMVYSATGLPSGLSINASTGLISGTLATGTSGSGPGTGGGYTVRATVVRGAEAVSTDFLWVVSEAPTTTGVHYRINASGGLVAATDGGPDWSAGTGGNGFQDGGFYTVSAGRIGGDNGDVEYGLRDGSIPSTMDMATYQGLFRNERWDPGTAPEMSYVFPVPNGRYRVNVFLMNYCSCTDQVGERVFSIAMEGNVLERDMDLVARYGHRSGGMVSHEVEVSDGELSVTFLHGVENPLVNAIEIFGVEEATSLQLKTNMGKNTNLLEEVVVYPNPVSSGAPIFINVPNAILDEPISVEIYNTLGSKVMERKYQANNIGIIEFEIDNNIASGVYIIRIAVGKNRVKTQKLIIR
jgi:hypothetical protein